MFSGLIILVAYFIKIISSLKAKQYINKGSAFAHVGLGILFLSLSVNSLLSYQKNINLSVGESLRINESIESFKFSNLNVRTASNHDVISANVFILMDGVSVNLNPEKRKYSTRGQITSETAIHATPFKDTYLNIGDQLEDGSWTFSLKINYFVKWIWLSSALMVLGMVLAMQKRKI